VARAAVRADQPGSREASMKRESRDGAVSRRTGILPVSGMVRVLMETGWEACIACPALFIG